MQWSTSGNAMIGTTAVTETRAERPESRAAKTSWSPDEFLRLELEAQQALFQVQPKSTQRWLEAQARSLGEGIVQGLPHIRFSLPGRVVVETTPAYGLHLGDRWATLSIPSDGR